MCNPLCPGFTSQLGGWGREEQEWFVQWNMHKTDDWVLNGGGGSQLARA